MSRRRLHLHWPPARYLFERWRYQALLGFLGRERKKLLEPACCGLWPRRRVAVTPCNVRTSGCPPRPPLLHVELFRPVGVDMRVLPGRQGTEIFRLLFGPEVLWAHPRLSSPLASSVRVGEDPLGRSEARRMTQAGEEITA